MSYQLKRINPFWNTNPMIPVGVVIGGILGLVGFQMGKPVVGGAGGVIAAAAILLATKPVVSGLLATLGLFGGLVQFVFMPNLNSVGMSMPLRIGAAALFGLFYMVLMDALVLVISVLYNLFAGTIGLGGIRLELAEAEEDAA
jgi:hypothetical protein